MLCMFIFISCGTNSTAVETESEAIKIAENYVTNKYKQGFKDYKINVSSNDGTWIVSYSKGKYILGGGGPEVRIDKSNGKVISCLLQK